MTLIICSKHEKKKGMCALKPPAWSGALSSYQEMEMSRCLCLLMPRQPAWEHVDNIKGRE